MIPSRFASLRVLAAAALTVGLVGCSTPPPESYVSAGQSTKAPVGLGLGNNASGEACTQQQSGETAADVYCGTWGQPSARIRSAGRAGPEALSTLATASSWRNGLNDRFNCGDPTSTSILGGQPAVLLQCTQRIGGWPHLALVASINGSGWYADGVLPALPAMERSIGVMSGTASGQAVSSASSADALLASRLADKAFSSGDVGAFEQLMTVAARANQTEKFADAEKAYRAALAVQQKALGENNPATAGATLNLALQISNQKRFVEAEALFARADRLVGSAPDASQQARLTHYRALHARNQGKLPEALALLDKAEPAYISILPAEVLTARPANLSRGAISSQSGGGGVADLLPNRDLLTDVTTRAGLLGLIEVRRYRAVVLRNLGRLAESEAALKSASTLAQANGLRQPVLSARLARTTAAAASAGGNASAAADAYETAATAFAAALPDSRPVAETQLLRASELLRAGQTGEALAACQMAVSVMRQIRIGADAKLLAPCLDVYATAAEKRPGAERQTLLVQMFEAAQLAQGGVTSAQIAQATARLSENARDPKVAEAIRARQDAGSRLTDLYRERDQVEQVRSSGGDANVKTPASAELDKRIAEAQEAVNNAEAALQAASPNYGQLVQQLVPVADVTAALNPGEGFVSITLTETGGWSFLVRDGTVFVGRVDGGTKKVADLVRRVRASIESDTGVPPAFDTKSAQDLYAATMGGLDTAMQGMKAMVVAPAGPLLSVPFGLLLTGPAAPTNLAEAPWLLRRMDISHVPAAANFVSLRKIAGGSRARQPWFGFGDFRPVTVNQATRSFGAECADSARQFAGLAPLPFARRELEAARLLLGGDASGQLLGVGFTADAVRKATLKDFRILHFATHALLPNELQCQTEAAIVTSAPPGAADAGGALLTSSAVIGLDLDADTVILSACNSGGPGGSTGGESLSGLARSFFYAGARSLMVTHWSVNDQAAAFLVADSLRRLGAGEGNGMAGAMRNAQLGMLDNAGKGLPAELAHPFYWAPFALIGEGTNKRVVTAALTR